MAAPAADSTSSSIEGVSAVRRCLHLLALSGFAIAQPVMFRLQQNPAYLRLERMEFTAVCLAVAVVVFVPTAVLSLLAIVMGRTCGTRAGIKAHTASVFLLILLFLLTMNFWLVQSFQLMRFGISDLLMSLIAVPLAGAMTSVYQRRAAVRQFLEYSLLGVFLFPVNLFTNAGIQSVLWPPAPASTARALSAQKPRPVILIVFDGFCGMSLLDREHNIDAVRFPGFASLAATSSWYRNATTVHYRTGSAVPAVLSGNVPYADGAPVEATWPNNLFRFIYDTDQFDMLVLEPVTRLCPKELLEHLEKRSTVVQTKLLLSTLSRVYLKTTFPDGTPGVDSPIPHTWFGIAEVTNPQYAAKAERGCIIYPWDTYRPDQFDHFIRCLTPREKTLFAALHIVAPHDPWSLFPDGTRYLDNPGFNLFPQGAMGEIGEIWSNDERDAMLGWQRYLMQLQWVDAQIARTIDQLKDSGLWEDCLLVVTADHGMSFVPGMNRREPSDETLADIMSVPLFVKLPGQSQGETSDANVETIDVLPTILDVLQLNIDVPFDGQSIAGEFQPRLRKTMIGPEADIVTEPDFQSRFASAARMHALFGAGDEVKLSTAMQVRPELLGTRVDQFPQVSPDLKTVLLSGGDGILPGLDCVPCFFEAKMIASTSRTEVGWTQPIDIAIAVNGIIESTTRTSSDERIHDAWSAFVPPTCYSSTPFVLEIFRVLDTAGSVQLQPILIHHD
ncbi:MAG: sulfatase-like hydrolase/transferase [Planctomycetaceae bacterium]|nr:sulfatase-like hydrolase/transferase [Planctomycetaceae bacterium]